MMEEAHSAISLGGGTSEPTSLRDIIDHSGTSVEGRVIKADLRRLSDSLQGAVVAERPGSFLFSSGGTSASPTLSFIPGHMFVDDILKMWSPLDRRDVFSNAFRPGRLWSAHYFFHLFGQRSAGLTISYGAPEGEDEILGWTGLMADRRVSALAATPSALRSIVRVWEKRGKGIPSLRKILWVGEPMDSVTVNLIHQINPSLELYGLYGSTETWVIATNGPNCGTDTFHPLPYQAVEIAGDSILVSCRHPDSLNPIVRYETGDRGEFIACPCGRIESALRVVGRVNDIFKFRGHLVDPDAIGALVRTLIPDASTQVVVDKSDGALLPLAVHICTSASTLPDPMQVKYMLLGRNLDLANSFLKDPERFAVAYVSDLVVNSRTGKSPSVVMC